MFSIIIPTYNEADRIAKTISITHAAIGKHEAEIIVVDGCSTDDTINVAEQCGATVINMVLDKAHGLNYYAIELKQYYERLAIVLIFHRWIFKDKLYR